MLARLGTMEQLPKYWFNTKTSEVEQGHKSLALYRIGPFDTREEAARAFEILAARTKALEDEEALDD